jgi:hypothetical protein
MREFVKRLLLPEQEKQDKIWDSQCRDLVISEAVNYLKNCKAGVRYKVLGVILRSTYKHMRKKKITRNNMCMVMKKSDGTDGLFITNFLNFTLLLKVIAFRVQDINDQRKILARGDEIYLPAFFLDSDLAKQKVLSLVATLPLGSMVDFKIKNGYSFFNNDSNILEYLNVKKVDDKLLNHFIKACGDGNKYRSLGIHSMKKFNQLAEELYQKCHSSTVRASNGKINISRIRAKKYLLYLMGMASIQNRMGRCLDVSSKKEKAFFGSDYSDLRRNAELMGLIEVVDGSYQRNIKCKTIHFKLMASRSVSRNKRNEFNEIEQKLIRYDVSDEPQGKKDSRFGCEKIREFVNVRANIFNKRVDIEKINKRIVGYRLRGVPVSKGWYEQQKLMKSSLIKDYKAYVSKFSRSTGRDFYKPKVEINVNHSFNWLDPAIYGTTEENAK